MFIYLCNQSKYNLCDYIMMLQDMQLFKIPWVSYPNGKAINLTIKKT